MGRAMRWVSAISRKVSVIDAVVDVAVQAQRALGEGRVDLALLFVSQEQADEADRAGAALREALAARVLIGCTARSVLGDGREPERVPAVSLVAARLPGVDLHGFALHPGQVRALAETPDLWRSLIGGGPPGEYDAPGGAGSTSGRAPSLGVTAALPQGVLLLADPFSFDAEACLGGVATALPGVPVIGGLASAGSRPGENRLYRDDQVHRGGAVGVSLSGPVHVTAVVAQGCRPIGQPLFVTACEGNRLIRLDGRPPVELLRELYAAASPADRELLRGSLFLGLEMKAAQQTYGAGDFLIRNVLGVAPESGELVVAARLHEGQVVQFHLRDARASADDLERRLAEARRSAPPGAEPDAALLFSCLGRGEGLYGVPDHDSALVRRHFGPIALGGFFCSGEIGPVQGRTFLHGYTSSLALIGPPPT